MTMIGPDRWRVTDTGRIVALGGVSLVHERHWRTVASKVCAHMCSQARAVSPDGSHDQVTMHRIMPLEQGNYLLDETATELVPADVTISLTWAGGQTSELSLAELQRWARGRARADAGPLDAYAAEISRRYGSRRYGSAVSLHLSPLPVHSVTLSGR